MTGPDGPGGSDLVPWLALGAVLVLLLAGWWAFPWLQRSVQRLDCIAAGYTNCDQ